MTRKNIKGQHTLFFPLSQPSQKANRHSFCSGRMKITCSALLPSVNKSDCHLFFASFSETPLISLILIPQLRISIDLPFDYSSFCLLTEAATAGDGLQQLSQLLHREEDRTRAV